MVLYLIRNVPAINDYRASPILLEHMEETSTNSTKNSTRTQALIKTAFTFSIHNFIVIHVRHNDDKRVVVCWIANIKKCENLVLSAANLRN